jgi:hypothetical protein
MGSEGEVHPLVAVLPPVPEQWAACPMYTSVVSKNTKLAVHCAPFVLVCTPGWTVADAADAHAGCAVAAVGATMVSATPSTNAALARCQAELTLAAPARNVMISRSLQVRAQRTYVSYPPARRGQTTLAIEGRRFVASGRQPDRGLEQS